MSADNTLVTIVGLLDELVAAVVKKHKGKVRAGFLDWVADEMTPRLERLALARFGTDDGREQRIASEGRQWVMKTCLSALEEKIHATHTQSGRGARIDILLDDLTTTLTAGPQKNV